jgi:prepilin signal peptidase PulO-like enzyme (type II secretory pathway)
VPMMLFRKLNEQRHIPFGPYICVGTLLAAFFAQDVLGWYLRLLGG